MENVEKIRSAEGEANASNILLDEFLRVDADDFAAGVEERAAAVAGIDGSVGLNPGAGTGVGKSSDGADDAFRDAEEHGVAPIADGQNVIALADAGGVGEGEMRKVTFADGAFDFGEGDVEIGIDMNDSGFELLAVGEKREQVSSPRARWALVTMTPVPVTKKPEPELSSPFS